MSKLYLLYNGEKKYLIKCIRNGGIIYWNPLRVYSGLLMMDTLILPTLAYRLPTIYDGYEQCDQMARLRLIFWQFTKVKSGPIAFKFARLSLKFAKY